MRSSVLAILLALGTLAACSGGDDPAPTPLAIDSLTVTAMGPTHAILRWPTTAAAGFRVLRREGRSGAFQAVGAQLGPNVSAFEDSLLIPEQTYGYRVDVLDGFGDVQQSSTVTGVTMPPIPGIVVQTNSGPSAPSDSNGYMLSIKGPVDSVGGAIAGTGQRVFSPLHSGEYRVALAGLSPNCISLDSLTRTVTVHEQGIATRDTATFGVECRDPTKAMVRAIIRTSGDSIDPNGFVLRLIGEASGVADSEKAITPPTQAVPSDGGTFTFGDIPPGRVSLILEDVAPVCTVEPAGQQDFDVAALADIERTFDVTCTGSGGGGGSQPYVWRTTWSAAQVPTGTVVSLTLSLDLSKVPATYLSSFTANVRTNAGVVHADSVRRIGNWDVFTANPQTQGEVRISGVTTDQSKTGVVEIARIWYTVTGATGTSLTPNTLLTTLSSRLASGADQSLLPDTRKDEGKLTVGAGAGGNQLPVARAGGPYTGQPGAMIAFTGASSSDADGSITGYAWTFGDGTTGTGAAPSKSYSAAGVYQVSLTVTDNAGATATAATTATISSGGGGGGQPFTYRPTWSVAQAPVGSQVSLTIAVDLSAEPGAYISAFTLNARSSSTVLHADSLRRLGTWDVFTSNIQVQGEARMSGVITDQSASGNVQIARVWYTVIGAPGATTTTQTELTTLSRRLTDGSNESLLPLTKLEEATFTVGGSGGGSNQPPTARAGGPYSGTAGAAVAFNGATSSDPDGSIASYAWNFGDGTTGASANPSKTYSAAGTYSVSLTVTDNLGASATATTTATISGGGSGGQGLRWVDAFSPAEPGMVTLTITMDMSQAAAGEGLAEWAVDELTWDPAVLQFSSFNWGSLGVGSGSLDLSGATTGRLRFSAAVAASHRTGVVPIATLRLHVVGGSGQSTTTHTTLGRLLGTLSSDLRGQVTISEGTFTAP